MTAITLEEARSAKQKAYERLRDVVEIVGVGISKVDGALAIKINLGSKPLPSVRLPEKIGRVPIKFEVVGQIRAARAHRAAF